MCEPQTRKKYLTRNSPPLPANFCCGRRELGNDGSEYVSRRTSAGICRWVPVSWNTTDKIVTRKPSVPRVSQTGRPLCMARDFKGLTKRGTDNKMWMSVATKAGHWVWTPKAKK